MKISKPVRFAAGAVGGLIVAAGVVAVTAQAVGFHFDFGSSPVAAATPAPVASPSPGAMPSPAPAAAGRRAIVAAEAQVLGLKPKDLMTDVKGGQTVAQLAQAKGLSQDQFRAALISAVQAMSSLDPATQQSLIQKLQTGAIPLWNGAMTK